MGRAGAKMGREWAAIGHGGAALGSDKPYKPYKVPLDRLIRSTALDRNLPLRSYVF